MAIDLMASSVTASNDSLCSESIFDNPIPSNHLQQQQQQHSIYTGGQRTTADLVALGGAFKTTAIQHSGITQMKLESAVQVAVQSNGNGHNHHHHQHYNNHNHLHQQQQEHHEKGNFMEHIRRSITFNGGVTTASLQPLTKLWLFRRHSSSSSSKRQKRQKRQNNSTTSTTSTTTSTTTKLDTNGNGGVPSNNGVSINISDQENNFDYRLNGHSNGHHNDHQLQHLTTTSNFTSSDIR